MIAYDSARPSLIPAGAQAIFPYADGHYSWSHKQFPKALYRYITVQGHPGIDIIDCEPGCVWPPSNVRPWAEARHRAGNDVTVYCDRDTVPMVRGALTGLVWHLFLSTLDGSQPTEFDGIRLRAVQYTDRNNAYDESIVYDEPWLNRP